MCRKSSDLKHKKNPDGSSIISAILSLNIAVPAFFWLSGVA
jgi:hypothetical protein